MSNGYLRFPPLHPQPPVALWLSLIVVRAMGEKKIKRAEVTLGGEGYYCVILYWQIQEGHLKEVTFYQRSEFIRA